MLTVSIVLYNTHIADVEKVLSCVIPYADVVFVIDNSPCDVLRIIEACSSKIRYIHNVNSGYGSAHNIALREAINLSSDFHLVINPDIFFDESVIPALLEYMLNNKDVVYILPRVLYPNGSMQYLCKLLPTPFDLFIRRFLPDTHFIQKINDKYVLKNSGYNQVMNPPCLSGCFMFLRLDVIKKNNLFFDEKYFMYCEDFDFIRRLHRKGETVYYPYVSIIHNHSKESYRNKKMLIVHIKSTITYFNKYGWFLDKERKQMNKKILSEISSRHKS